MQEPFPSESDIKEGISLICAVKNRNENLNKALGTWIKNPDINEIVIVDWDSDEPIGEVVEKYQDGRITLAHVPNQPKWVLTWAYNLAARLTSYSKILKLDADILLSNDFFKKCELTPASFLAGNWRNMKSEDEKHISGQMFLYRDDFFSINGFDERITTYGYDEEDLYDRLEMGIEKILKERKNFLRYRWTSRIRLRKVLPPALREKYAKFFLKCQQEKQIKRKNKHKYERKDIPMTCLKHLTHSNDTRVAYQDVDPNKLIEEAKLNRFKVTEPWNKQYEMKQFEISKLDENTLLCRMKDSTSTSLHYLDQKQTVAV